MISSENAASIERRRDAYENARRAFDPRRFEKGGGYTPAEIKQIEDLAGVKRPTNEELGALEAFNFATKSPERTIAYIDAKNLRATAWLGDDLGRVVLGSVYTTPAFGGASRRQPVTLYAINGWIYAGTYYVSAGDYASFKRTKKRWSMNSGTRANPCGCSARANPRKSKRRTTRR